MKEHIATILKEVSGNPGGLFKMKPGNGLIVSVAEHRFTRTRKPHTKRVPVYGAAPLRSGKTYSDSGYPGSIRRKMARGA